MLSTSASGTAASSPSRFGSTALLLAAFLGGITSYSIGSLARASPTISSGSRTPTFGTPADFQRAITELRAIFPASRISTNPDVLHAHGFSLNTYHPGAPHSVVISVESTEEVSGIVKVASKWRMPITAYSGGTSLEGGFAAHPRGGICVDLSGMDKIIKINEADSDLVCQAGARWDDINETLRDKGVPLFFPLDPAPGATIGGMIATGCSGTNAVRYGTAKAEWFLNVTVVLPSGEVIKTRRRARKSSAGFDTTKLFIGAEGTLGIVTEATIRLAPLLPTNVAVAQFPDVRKATEAVGEILNKGVPIQCIELCDDVFMHATNNYGISTRKYPERDSLFFKFQGSPESIAESARVVDEIVRAHGGSGLELAKSEKEAVDLWADRKAAHFSGLALVPGSRGWGTDVCVPVSRLPDLVYETKKDLEESGLVSTIVGHVGDGNFHSLILFKTDEELEAVRGAVHRMVERAIRLDGTCTGEHGVGIGKKEYLYEELGTGTVELMKLIKRTIDPLGIFNPGKVVAHPARLELECLQSSNTPDICSFIQMTLQHSLMVESIPEG
ncbi:hypothetical protein BOTBODRAFT_111787 [Botryobasidium botryosum FD-172 SS1]|uniref:D-lactate dehydrogenase (cytochrome) n=1 Tax=Botryobasidium botryosum (strain FD-172 SS1) TaxID=930990 RepID=A0A067MMP2_BOTB1|nr:hypothetical protein BOTBODRAFT_111787 [Botryobasidium botryosum FD-172 SS1]